MNQLSFLEAVTWLDIYRGRGLAVGIRREWWGDNLDIRFRGGQAHEGFDLYRNGRMVCDWAPLPCDDDEAEDWQLRLPC